MCSHPLTCNNWCTKTYPIQYCLRIIFVLFATALGPCGPTTPCFTKQVCVPCDYCTFKAPGLYPKTLFPMLQLNCIKPRPGTLTTKIKIVKLHIASGGNVRVIHTILTLLQAEGNSIHHKYNICVKFHAKTPAQERGGGGRALSHMTLARIAQCS